MKGIRVLPQRQDYAKDQRGEAAENQNGLTSAEEEEEAAGFSPF